MENLSKRMDMAYTNKEKVQAIYIAYYQRPADSDGLIFWEKYYENSNGNVDQVVNAFGNSKEAHSLYGEINDDTIGDVIDMIYRAAFNRDADPEGKKFYMDGFKEGKFTAATIMLNIIDGAVNEDAVILSNKIESAMNFTKAIDPDLDGQDLLATYAGQADIDAAREYLKSVNEQTESIHDEMEAMGYVKEFIADAGDPILDMPTGNIKYLSVKQDNIDGTKGEDQFNATSATLNMGDVVDGKGDTDVLKYFSNKDANHSAFELHNIENIEVTSDNGANIQFDMSGSDGIKTFSTINSTGDVTFSQVTELADLEIENLTATAPNNVTVALNFQDAVVAGDNDEITVTMIGNSNANAGVVRVGSTNDDGIETINVVSKGSANTIMTLDSEIKTLNISGDQNFKIEDALARTLDMVDSRALEGRVNLDLSANSVSATDTGRSDKLEVYTGSGNDVISMYTDIPGSGHGNDIFVKRDAIVDLGDGDDIFKAGMGNDVINLGAGNDRLSLHTNGLTVGDMIDGGDGSDTLVLLEKDFVMKSESEKVSSIETFKLKSAGSEVYLTQNLIDSLSPDNDLTVDTRLATGDHTIDITNIDHFSTAKLVLEGGKYNDTVVADDATINSGAHLDFGAGVNDTVVIKNGANVTAEDFKNIDGVEVLRLDTDSSSQQRWQINIDNDMVLQSSRVANGVADAQTLTIVVDPDIAAGSVLDIDASKLDSGNIANGAVRILTTNNVKVNMISANPKVEVVKSLEYTSGNNDLVGTKDNDVFHASTVSYMEGSDSADGQGGIDELVMDFGISNEKSTLRAQVNNTGIQNIEVMRFNTADPVKFSNVDYKGVTTVVTGWGDDVITKAFYTNGVTTYELGDGDDTLVSSEETGVILTGTRVEGGSGDDSFYFRESALDNTNSLNDDDRIIGGSGDDTLYVNHSVAADSTAVALGGFNLTGRVALVDTIDYLTDDAGDSFIATNALVGQADDGSTEFIIRDGDGGVANSIAIFRAGTVTSDRSAHVEVFADEGRSGDAPDVFLGAGDDEVLFHGKSGDTSYVIQGNAGADYIEIDHEDSSTEQVRVLFGSPNDGSDAGETDVHDTISGFVSANSDSAAVGDILTFRHADFTAIDALGIGAGSNLAVRTDQSVDFSSTTANANVLVMTHNKTGLLDDEIVDLDKVIANVNVLQVASDSGFGGLIVAQGNSSSAIYMYVEQDGTPNQVSADELKLLAVVEGDNHVGHDVDSSGLSDDLMFV